MINFLAYSLRVIKLKERTKLLKNLNAAKAMGPDEINPKVLKVPPGDLAAIITHFCNSER